MLKEATYTQAADAFGTSVGVAHAIGYKNKREQIKEGGIESFKSIEPDLELNAIICDAIEINMYQELQREIYRIKLTNKRIKKELSIYKKAWKNITNG